MDFFARQESSRRTTRYLALLFGAAFLIVALATALVIAIGFDLFSEPRGVGGNRIRQGNLLIFGVVTGIMLAFMLLASLFRSASLTRGGGQVARMLGGTEAQARDPDLLRQRLVNVVEEMSIASGVPVPEVYVLEQESGINAFAAGLTHADAAVAVTRGCLERLTRAELQGVVAHEFSHILNGDMRLNLRLMGFSYGILVLAQMGRGILRAMARTRTHSRSRKGNPILFVAVGLVIVGGIGVFFSRLIKAGVSRQREVLADASAVQFTREPLALAGALKKIGGFTTYLTAIETEEVAHMLFGRGTRSFSGWFATHPPLPKRILALDPTFDGRYPKAEPLPPPADEQALASGLAASAGPAGGGPERTGPASGPTPERDLAENIGLGRAGTLDAEAGVGLHAAIPADLRDAVHGGETAYLLALAFSVADDEAYADRQYALLELRIGAQRVAVCRRLRTGLADLDRALWLPLLELAIPTLKLRPQPQIEFLLELIVDLAAVDGEQSLFEYVLNRLLRTYFGDIGFASPSPLRRARASVAESTYIALATIAVFGHDDSSAARSAFEEGLRTLTGTPKPAAFVTLDRVATERSLSDLDAALDTLARLRPRSQHRLLAAIQTTVRHDRKISVEESELFRAIAATLGCPIPPAPLMS